MADQSNLTAPAHSGAWYAGAALTVIGLIGMVVAFFYPVTVSHTGLDVDAVANVDLIAQRALLHTTAAVLAIIGAILLTGARLLEKLVPRA